jgi:hypothetical protein
METQVGQIHHAEIENNIVSIFFIHEKNLISHDSVLILTYKDQSCFFQVQKLSTCITDHGGGFKVVATEYGRKKLLKDKDFNLLGLLHLKVTVVTDQEILKNLHQSSLYC